MALFIGAVAMALSISFLCSLLESATLSLQRADIAKLRLKSPELGLLWEAFKKRIDEPLAAILILNTAANTIGATVAGAQFARLSKVWGMGEWGLVFFSVVFAVTIIQWGEILPKTLGVRYRTVVALHAGRPLATLIRLLKPIMWVTHRANRPFEPRLPVDQASDVDEIQALVAHASLSRLITPRQEQIISKSIELDQLTVEHVMVPRTRVLALEDTASVAELIATVEKTGFSRIPIYRGEIDNIQGIVIAKDVLIALNDASRSSSELMRRPVSDFITRAVFVPENVSVAQFLVEARLNNAHMVVAVDEYGGFAGVMTLEDAFEEMFGEIVDEHDRVQKVMVERTGRDRWVARGLCPINELSQTVGSRLESKKRGYSTLSGLLMERAGKIPAAGDVLSFRGLRFKVLESSRTLPLRVEITKRKG